MSPSDGFSFEVGAGLPAAAAARRAVLAGDGALPDRVREDVLLLLTELVTNAVRHSGAAPGQPLHVELRQSSRWVRVAVVDPGGGFTRPEPRPAPDGPGGHGLLLVDRIADCWGVDKEQARTCVWFEIEFGG
jgi:anti-sigma regulatory factor (Ser/Thr protein kinase)